MASSDPSSETSSPKRRPIHLAVRDAVDGHWVDTAAPDWLKPYARLARWERPIGWWLLLFPCWWATAIAGIAADATLPNLWHLVLFMIGAIAMRGAGCTYNDLVDREIDASVDRTRSRPLPSGQVTPLQAKIFLVAQSLVGLAVLLQFNTYTIVLGMGSLLIVAIYPFMKRITHWPQSVLGLAFSWGALVGWSAQFGELDWPAVTLYLAAIAWTIGYDTIYAHQDREDDAVIGVKSTALLFGPRTKLMLSLFYGLTVLLIFVTLVGVDAGPAAFLGLAVFAGHLIWQIFRLDIDDDLVCLKLFRSNQFAGLYLFAGLTLEVLIA